MANRGMIYLTPEPDVPQIIFEETTLITEIETHKSTIGPNLFQNPKNLQYPLHLPGSIEEVPRSISPGDPFIQPLSDSTPVEDSNGGKIVAVLQSQRTLKRTGKSKGILEFSCMFLNPNNFFQFEL